MNTTTQNPLNQFEARRQLVVFNAKNGNDTVNCMACDAVWTQVAQGYIPTSRSGECVACAAMRRTRRFAELCPKLYQSTEESRLPAEQLGKAMAWQYGARGLILLGETGKGKSRVMWQLLRRVMTTDEPERKVVWFDAVGFGHEIMRRFNSEDHNIAKWLDSVATAPIVFFDDLGKLKLTERAEVELFGVIERRCANELPILATTNDTGDSLAARMSDNRGPAMIRRLREFCEAIQF